MNRILSPAVHGVMAGDDLVLLDVRSDSYLCLPACERVVLAADGRGVRIPDPALAADLEAAGLIARSGAQPPAEFGATPPPLPTRSAATAPAGPPDPSVLPEAARAVADLVVNYVRRPFADILRRAARRGPAAPAAEPGPDLLAVVERFRRWAPYAPVSGKCLLRSFMLLRLLRRHGHDALWVFGVRTYPFAAHCWLQVGDMALDDAHERLAAFHPLMAV